MYTIILDEGLVIRDYDKKVMAPTQSDRDPDFLEYTSWANLGNMPTIYDTRPASF